MRLTNHVQHQSGHGFSGFGVDIGVEPAARSGSRLSLRGRTPGDFIDCLASNAAGSSVSSQLCRLPRLFRDASACFDPFGYPPLNAGLTTSNYPAYFTMRLTNHVQHQVRHGFSGFGVDIGVEPAARSGSRLSLRGRQTFRSSFKPAVLPARTFTLVTARLNRRVLRAMPGVVLASLCGACSSNPRLGSGGLLGSSCGLHAGAG